MKKNKVFKDSRPLEMLDYLDEAYIAEVVDNLNLQNEQSKPLPKKAIILRSVKTVAILAACAVLLGALIPVVNYVTSNFPHLVAFIASESTETEAESTEESSPDETTAPPPETAEEETTSVEETTEHVHDLVTTENAPSCTEWVTVISSCACGYTVDEKIPPRGHNFVNDVCTACGAENGSEGLEYSIVSGSHAIFTGIGTCTDTDIVIASEYKGYPVLGLEIQALRGRNKIISLKIPEGITEIPQGFFYQCTALEEVILPDSIKVIGEGAFAHCTALKEIKLPAFLERIESHAFSGCSALARLDLPESVSYVGPYFLESTQIDSFHISKNITDIGYGSFSYGCLGTNVKKITVDPDHPRYIITGNCLIDREQKMLIRAFGEPEFPTDGSIEIISEMAFYMDDFKLKKLILPEGLIKINWYNSEAFKEIEEVYIPSTCVYLTGYNFAECKKIQKITVAEGNPRFYSSGNCVIEKETGILVVGCNTSVIPADGSVTAIGEYAFCGRKELKDITIPEGVTKIDNSAFPGCSSLTEIILPESLESIGYAAFYGCSAIEKIEMGKNVREILLQALEGCLSLREIVFGGTMAEWKSGDYDIYIATGTPTIVVEKITCSDGVINQAQ